jgi:hypothetical protein
LSLINATVIEKELREIASPLIGGEVMPSVHFCVCTACQRRALVVRQALPDGHQSRPVSALGNACRNPSTTPWALQQIPGFLRLQQN